MIGFVVAIMLFVGSFYYLTQATIDREADTTASDNANIQARAASLADVLLQSGDGWYAASPCKVVNGEKELDLALFDPDGISTITNDEVQGRFGLGEETCLRPATDPQSKNNLSYAKLYNLYGAAEDADDDNGHVDYEEARTSLGLEEDENFHIRSWPVLSTVRDVLGRGYKDPTMRPLYIGDYIDPTEAVEEVPHSTTIVDSSDKVTAKLTITNDGLDPAIFATLFEIELDKSTVGFTLHTPLLITGQGHTVEFTLRKSSDWTWDDPSKKRISYEIQDRDGWVGDGEIDLSGVNMDYIVAQTNVFVEADTMYFEKEGDPSATIKMNFMAFQGDGSKKKFSDWTLVTTDPLGIPMVALPLQNNVFDGVSSQVAVTVGKYKGDVRNDLVTSSWNYDYMNVVEESEDVGSYKKVTGTSYVPNAAVAPEASYVEALIRDFDKGVFDEEYDSSLMPHIEGGDVYPDVKSVMNDAVVDAISENGVPIYDYTMMVIGSNVDHNVMTSASAKYAIRDWVMGGGTLLVFGSDDQSIQWLQPLFHASLETANGGLQTPDEGHPVLHVPNDLDYAGYEYETQWGYSAGAEQSFTSVVSTSGGGDILAVGNPGAFGDGRVILTSWRPYDLLPTQAASCPSVFTAETQCEAIFLIHNTMTMSYRYLYLDYGPGIPDDAVVGSHLRLVSVYHPELREVVTVQLQLFVFD